MMTIFFIFLVYILKTRQHATEANIYDLYKYSNQQSVKLLRMFLNNAVLSILLFYAEIYLLFQLHKKKSINNGTKIQEIL